LAILLNKAKPHFLTFYQHANMEKHEQPAEDLTNEQNPTAEQELNQHIENTPENDQATETDDSESDPQSQQPKKNKRGSRGGSSEGNGQKVKELEAEKEKLAAELGEAKDKYLRLYAEFDNYRKRTNRELLEMQKTANQSTLKSLLSTLDDFERAIKAADAPNATETIPEGLRLVHAKLTRTLEAQGLKLMESTGMEFNPDLHEAIVKIPAPAPELKGKIVDTVEAGYYLNEKIIRYAKVVIGE
jgi:molecular chaperone GrpE